MRYTHPNVCTHRLQALNLGDDSNPAPVPLTIPEGGAMPFGCPTCRVGLANHYLQQIQCVLVEPTSVMMNDPWAGPEPEFVHCWNNRAAFAGSLVNSFRAMLWAEGEVEQSRPTWAGPWRVPDYPGQDEDLGRAYTAGLPYALARWLCLCRSHGSMMMC
ncbi:hypothetical protein N656DRAFT_831653 [Canariomyces notabilis]|uniref:Uncharacterized protein n=1 Tax=Canariomyces notabilis TaxID=2074819 RepID=A0AAN6T906_9PEZI|nr:hypothetical protein N656DRAFT_831653 [Canariomyces arenarius]